jgi:hypothetical protein
MPRLLQPFIQFSKKFFTVTVNDRFNLPTKGCLQVTISAGEGATDVVTEDIKRLANNTLVGVRFIIQMDER